MVLIAARSVGRPIPRAEQTKDADVLVDVCTDPGALPRVVGTLRSLGYDIPAHAWDRDAMARCTFVSGRAQIDVLCPEDAMPAALDAVEGVRSLAIPGGRRALELAEPVRITYAEDAHDVCVRVPLMPGAVVVKAHAAVDPKTINQPRHAQDVVGLATVIEDPVELARALSPADKALLASLVAERLADEGDIAWEGLAAADRQQALAALRILSAWPDGV